MKSISIPFVNLLLAYLLVSAICVSASDKPYHETNGFGTDSEGGLSGYVYHVTHLGNYGSGSLRYALQANYPRLVVFDVGGVIDLEMDNISIKNPYITVAGQTAPYPGITVIKGGISVGTHDVVIQHIAVRPGDAAQEQQSGWEPDGMSTYGTDTYNIVFDHCSATWAVDENLSVSGPGDSDPFTSSYDVTLYRCIIAEALANSSHSKGLHSMGTLLHDGVSDVSIIGCLYAHNNQRNPLFKGSSSAVFVNNVIYNSGAYAVQMTDYGTSSGGVIGQSKAAIIGNTWIKGVDSSTKPFIRSGQGRVSGKAYLEDNILIDQDGMEQQETDGNIELVDSPPLWPEGLEFIPSYKSIYNVLSSAGAHALYRDSIDQRIVNSFIYGTGQIIDSQEEVGGYPNHEMTSRVLQVPESTSDRRIWLDSLSAELDTDESLDTSPLNNIITGITESSFVQDYKFNLVNYPNPFNPNTTIEYTVPSGDIVNNNRKGSIIRNIKLIVNDSLGREIAVLINKKQAPGRYQVSFDGSELASGVYLCRLSVGDHCMTNKIVLIK